MARIYFHESYIQKMAKNEEKSLRNRIMRFLKRIFPRIFSHFFKEDYRWRQGFKGQLEVQKYINNLSDEYEIHHDFPVHNSDIDHIVIGPNGIFVIQTKNLSGKVIFKNGKLYRIRKNVIEDIDNLISQIIDDTYKLLEYLENQMYIKGIKVNLPQLNPILVFASATKLEVDDKKHLRVQILCSKDLCDYIMNFKGDKISKKRQRKIELLFSKENVEYKRTGINTK